MGDIIKTLTDNKFVPIVRVDCEDGIIPSVSALVRAGVKIVELTMTSPGAVKSLEALVKKYPDVVFGMGSIIKSEDAVMSIKAGAKFIVTPVLRKSVAGNALKYGTALIIGAFSPTEIVEAWEQGADAVKVFPAGMLGTGYLRSLLGPMPFLKLIPTGGINLQNALDYLSAGAVAVGIGSHLVRPELVRSGKFDEIEKLAKIYIERIVLGKHTEGRIAQ